MLLTATAIRWPVVLLCRAGFLIVRVQHPCERDEPLRNNCPYTPPRGSLDLPIFAIDLVNLPPIIAVVNLHRNGILHRFAPFSLSPYRLGTPSLYAAAVGRTSVHLRIRIEHRLPRRVVAIP
jgi:hypothetical protein